MKRRTSKVEITASIIVALFGFFVIVLACALMANAGEFRVDKAPEALLEVKCDGSVILRGKLLAKDKELGDRLCPVLLEHNLLWTTTDTSPFTGTVTIKDGKK